MSIKRLAPASRMPVRHTALAVAVAMGFGFSGHVSAQSTTGTIAGQAPVAAGETIQITGGSGFNRTVPVDSKSGRYSITLPVGTYTVTLLQNGNTVQSKSNVTALAASAVAVDFVTASTANAQNLSSVMVTANAIPPIDVTSTNQSTTITAEQLKHLPLQRSAEAIALLAPGTVQGASALNKGPTGSPLVSFGGSSVAENAYYINGFNTSDPIGNQGGLTLPYGAIAQQQTLTSGYEAQYGRSAGGVISQIGQSGTNTWHFGGQVLWQPAFAGGTPANLYYENPASTVPGQEKGNLLDYRNADSQWNEVYDGYLGGPLIKDTLFFFIAAEADRTHDTNLQPNATTGNIYYQQYSNPKMYGKIDWNINDSNTLGITYVKNSYSYDSPIYNYNYNTLTPGSFSSYDQSFKNSYTLWNGKFTSYLTDDLTLNAMFGKMTGTLYTYQPPFDGSSLPNIIEPFLQNPALNGNSPISNPNTNSNINNPNNTTSVLNLRFDLEWKVGDHDIQVGIDNDTSRDINAGSLMTGPGYAWLYNQASSPTTYIAGSTPGAYGWVDAPGNYPNGAGGYYVAKYVFTDAATVEVAQRAQYIQDRWQVTPNLLLSLGLRNDQFTNYNPSGVPYLRLTSPQWAPRLGATWDVFGDSSLKVFGNAGRYYLAMPSAVALRDAGAPLYEETYYTYAGIDPVTGIPTGLTPIASNPTTNVPVNNENGSSLDPKVVASRNLKAEYQDEFVAGMQQQINPSWDYGVTAMYRSLGRAIDDTGYTQAIYNAMIAQGANPATLTINDIDGSILINPGQYNVIVAKNNAGGYNTAVVTNAMLGMPQLIRKYYSLEMFLEHPWDGKWTAKFDYVFSRSWGNTEGPVQSNIGQGGNSVSATEQWDYPQIMSNSNGLQANNQKHQFRLYGTYQILPEWTVSAVLQMASGTPKDCLGYYGPNQTDPISYGSSYHWCFGNPSAPGASGSNPWTEILSLQAEYRPEWANKKLGFQIQVYNVFNQQRISQIYAQAGSTSNPNPLYLSAIENGTPSQNSYGVETPRYIQFGITYDW
jgi:hypothetical protein